MSRDIFTAPCTPTYVNAVLRGLTFSHVDLLEIYCKCSDVTPAQHEGGVSYQTLRGKTRFKFVYASSAFCATAEGKTLEEAKNKAAALALEQVTGVKAFPLDNEKATHLDTSDGRFNAQPSQSASSSSFNPVASSSSFNPVASSSSAPVLSSNFGDQHVSSGPFAPARGAETQSSLPPPSSISNPIGAVSEYCVRNKWHLPCFIDHGRTGGTDHQPTFVCSVEFNGMTFVGSGGSKKHAKHDAASQLATRLGLR